VIQVRWGGWRRAALGEAWLLQRTTAIGEKGHHVASCCVLVFLAVSKQS
jgi:hypothetical protein